MNKLLIAAMMMAALSACSQEAKQETKEAASAVASEVKDAAASATDAAASSAQAAASKVEDTAAKAASEVKEAPASEAKPAEKTEAAPADEKKMPRPPKWTAKLFSKPTVKCATAVPSRALRLSVKMMIGLRASNKAKKPCINMHSKASTPCRQKAATPA